jgi:hypothetical protein
MLGSMDLTTITTRVEDATFTQSGAYLASFLLEGELVAQVYPEVVPSDSRQAAERSRTPKKSDVIWVGPPRPPPTEGDKTVPAWFAYKGGKIYVLSSGAGTGGAGVPGVPGAGELVIITRRKGRNTSLSGSSRRRATWRQEWRTRPRRWWTAADRGWSAGGVAGRWRGA